MQNEQKHDEEYYLQLSHSLLDRYANQVALQCEIYRMADGYVGKRVRFKNAEKAGAAYHGEFIIVGCQWLNKGDHKEPGYRVVPVDEEYTAFGIPAALEDLEFTED